jgi:hypothetical protein
MQRPVEQDREPKINSSMHERSFSRGAERSHGERALLPSAVLGKLDIHEHRIKWGERGCSSYTMNKINHRDHRQSQPRQIVPKTLSQKISNPEKGLVDWLKE